MVRLVVRQVVRQVMSPVLPLVCQPVKLTERQQVILGIIHRFVVEHVVEGVVEAGVEIPSALSIAKQIDTSSRTVQRELAYLQAHGIIRRVGADFSGHWEIIEK